MYNRHYRGLFKYTYVYLSTCQKPDIHSRASSEKFAICFLAAIDRDKKHFHLQAKPARQLMDEWCSADRFITITINRGLSEHALFLHSAISY